jgi:hypothetical protein
MGQNWSLIVPEATVNLCTNPSFELATTGWSASGSNTIARSAAQQFAGVYSLLCTYQNNTTLATLTISSGLNTGTTYTITARLYVPADWNGDDIRLNASGFTSATVTQVREWDSAIGETGKWVELEIRLATSADATGTILLQTTGAPSAGRAVYLDCLQIEAKAYPTTYCDGDQPGCAWSGTPHASSSSRDEFEASGGRLMNLDTDFNFLTGADEGTGVFPLQMLFHPQPLLPGDNFQGINVQSRSNLLLRGGFDGETTPGLHAKRQALAKALNSRVGRIDQKPQPRQLYYHGAAVEKRIGVYYVAGLGVKDRIGTVGERIDGLQFYAPDPAWYDVGERGVTLTPSASSTFRMVAALIDGQWDTLGPPSSVGGADPRAYAFAEDDTYVYIGGGFTDVSGNANSDWIARMNKVTKAWSNLGSGTKNNTVNGLAVAADGRLYAVGQFTNMDVAANRIAVWNGSSWSALGTGLNGISEDVAVGIDGRIYVVGGFTTAGGSSANRIAVWNGSSWSTLGTGFNGTARAIHITVKGEIYAGGVFTQADGATSVDRIAKWNPDSGAWEAMGSFGGAITLVTSITSDPSGDKIFAAGGAGVVLQWNGAIWTTIGDSDGSVQSLVYIDNQLYAGGEFTEIGGLSNLKGLAIWNGSSWSPAEISLPDPPLATPFEVTVANLSGHLYVSFNSEGTGFYPANTSVSYEGTELACPTISIKRSGGTSARLVSLTNLTTGAKLYFDYSLIDGETITIDLRPSSLSALSSQFGKVPRAILPNSDISMFFVAPGNAAGPQVNTIACLVLDAGSPTITATMKWRNTYSSYD